MNALVFAILVSLSSLSIIAGDEFEDTFIKFFEGMCENEEQREEKTQCLEHFPVKVSVMAMTKTACEDVECVIKKMCVDKDIRNEIVRELQANPAELDFTDEMRANVLSCIKNFV
ncbi:uncharacterized protein LOC118192284 [Stegodyphus dumicola]|uniref:uncharacterized protein LOC118192284 n=1 Tax=Stegodyphus dumicola TaxID=202533 RepID=UPI0015B331A9|nr:uncharacterized protein LOC118192284 [Stegodyphus dumicola]